MIEFRGAVPTRALFVLLVAVIASVATWTTTNDEASADHNCTVSLATSFSVAEGGSGPVSATATNCDEVQWDLDNDGQYDDGLGTSVNFSAVGRDGVSTQTIGVQATSEDEVCEFDPEIKEWICYPEYDSDSAGSTVNITNVAPSATFTAPETVDEGDFVQIGLSGASDPGPGDLSGLDYFSYNCVGVWGMWTLLSPAACDTPDGPNTMSVSGRVRDNDSAQTVYTEEVTVLNAPPTATKLEAPKFVRAGNVFFATLLDPADPFPGDELSYAFDCGAGYGENLNEPMAECEAPTTAGDMLVKGRVMDDDGAEDEHVADVFVDAEAPTGTIKINDGDASTTKREVKLKLTATDPDPGSGVTKMRFSNTGNDWSRWVAFETTRSWTLSRGEGKKEVFVQYRDKVRFKSAKIKDTITLK